MRQQWQRIAVSSSRRRLRLGTSSSQHHLPNAVRAMSNQPSQASDWSSKQYLKFEDERTIPVRDLLAKVPTQDPKLVVDLGCGPGNSTSVLAERYGNATIEGMDSSADMLQKARSTLPNIKFTQANLQSYVPDSQPDLLFSNAVFHWLPETERLSVMQRLLQGLHPGGVLAIQVPDNFHEPSHSSMRAVAHNGPWAAELNKLKPEIPSFPSPAAIYNALSPLCTRLDVWHTCYNHVVKDHQAIVEWVKGSGLRPFIDPLTEKDRQEFLTRYLALIKQEYKPLVDGRVMLSYPRLFVVATRG